MTITKTPIRTVFTGSDPVGLAEFQTGEVIPVDHGGTAANTISGARINLSVDDSNIRNLFSVVGSGSYNNSTGVITVTGGITAVAGVEGNISNSALLAGIEETGFLTTANITEVTNLYFTNERADLRVGPAFDTANTAISGVSTNAGAISSLQSVTISQGTAITNAHNQANVATVNASSAFDSSNTKVATVGGVTNTSISNVQLASAVNETGIFTTANVAEVTNLYYTDVRAFANLTSASTTSLQEGTNLYFTNARVISALSGSDVSIGELTVSGNLFVQGNVTEFNTATLVIEDKNIFLANGASTAAAADGAGITVDGADATILYVNSSDRWSFNKPVEVSGTLSILQGDDIASGNIVATGNINATGEITSPFFYSQSDVSLKENIENIFNPIEILNGIQGVKYIWKKSKQPGVGVIAQDVEQVLPEIVSTNGAGIKTVSYDSLVAVLIEAVKQQQKEIELLKSKIYG